MGRATRWIRSLLTGRKDDRPTATATAIPKEKKRWSFTRSPKDQPAVDPAWLRSLYADAGSNHAIAVAAAQAADAAVVAAQAAVAVARLSWHGERRAAVRIQTAFRAFLARKALRALRALVKLQALVRGYLVRKRAAATLHSMQALVRAQATVRTYQQSRGARLRRSLERWDETRSEQGSRRVSSALDGLLPEGSPKIVEVDPGRPRSRGGGGGRTPGDETHSSPLARLSVPKGAHDGDWYLAGDECGGGFSTAQSTPRFQGGKGGAGSRYHNYMANTQSFRAKVRSQSAPKQRPEPRRRMSLSEMAESRASLSGVRMQKTCSRAQEAAAFDRSCDLHRHYDYYLQRRW